VQADRCDSVCLCALMESNVAVCLYFRAEVPDNDARITAIITKQSEVLHALIVTNLTTAVAETVVLLAAARELQVGQIEPERALPLHSGVEIANISDSHALESS
jgi:predicted transcriptional regulator